MMRPEDPFIHTFKTPRGFYFYDVNKDKIVSLSKEEYDFLSGIIPVNELDPDHYRHIEKLKSSGFLSSKRVQIIEHPYTGSLKRLLDRNIGQLVLQVTQACNLCCSYCPYANKTDGKYQRNASLKTMTWDMAKAAIDFFAGHSAARKDIIISFYGGEPMINFKLIEKSILYSEKIFLGKKLSFSITTNGTLMTEQMLQFFSEHHVNLTFSLDGSKKIHDLNRKTAEGKGSFDITFSNLKKAAGFYRNAENAYLGINMVINPENDDVEGVLDLFRDDVFKDNNIVISATLAEDDALEKKWAINDLFREKWNYQSFLGYLGAFHVVKNMNIPQTEKEGFARFFDEYESLKKEQFSLPDTGSPGGPCVPGVNKLFVNVDGDFYPCEKVNELSEVMKIGSIEKGFDFDRIEKLLNVAEITADECRNCFAFSHCTSCAYFADANDRLCSEKRRKYCSEIKRNFEGFLLDVTLLKEIRTLYGRPA